MPLLVVTATQGAGREGNVGRVELRPPAEFGPRQVCPEQAQVDVAASGRQTMSRLGRHSWKKAMRGSRG